MPPTNKIITTVSGENAVHAFLDRLDPSKVEELVGRRNGKGLRAPESGKEDNFRLDHQGAAGDDNEEVNLQVQSNKGGKYRIPGSTRKSDTLAMALCNPKLDKDSTAGIPLDGKKIVQKLHESTSFSQSAWDNKDSDFLRKPAAQKWTKEKAKEYQSLGPTGRR